MNIVGRFERVRELGPHGWGKPYVLDRRPYAQGSPVLRPFARRGEWWKSPSGVWVPTISGGAFLGSRMSPGVIIMPTSGSTASQQTLALNNAYTYGSAGNTIGVRIVWPADLGALSNVYYYVSASAGTPANVNDINAEFRNTSGSTKPGTTLHDSGSADPNGEAAIVGWHCIPWGTGFTPIAGTEYWVVIADADGDGTDYVTVCEGLAESGTFVSPYINPRRTADHATGWSSAATFRNVGLALVLQLGTNIVGGNYAAMTTPSASSDRRGWYIGGFTETLKIWGATVNIAGSNTSGLDYYATASDTPGSPTTNTTALVKSGSGATTGAIFTTPVQPAKATPVRLTFTFSGVSTDVRKLSLGVGNGYNTDALVRKARLGGADWYFAEANGTTDWANDDPDAQPNISLLVDDQVAGPTDAEVAAAVWTYGNRTLTG